MPQKETRLSKDLNVRLDEKQALKFQVLVDAEGTTRTETIRRILDRAYEHHIEGLSESKLDAIFRTVQLLHSDTSALRVQGEAARLDAAKIGTEVGLLKAAVAAGDKDAKVLLAQVFYDLRAIFEGHPKRSDLVVLRDRLMSEAANGGN